MGLPVVQDRDPGGNPAGSFQVVTLGARMPGEGSCPATDNCFDLRVDSFLGRAAAEVTLVVEAVSPSRQLSNADAPPLGSGLSSPYGLKTFGDLPALGSSPVVELRFAVPNLDPFIARLALYERSGSPFCPVPTAGIEGRYAGLATVYVYWGEVGDPMAPICVEHESWRVSPIEIEVVTAPTPAVHIVSGGAATEPYEIPLDFENVGYPPWETFAWSYTPPGSYWHQLPCQRSTYWEVSSGAWIVVDPATRVASTHVNCGRGWLDACSFSYNEITDWSGNLAFRCVPGATVCVDGNVVSCDAAGNLISSIPCGAPCAP